MRGRLGKNQIDLLCHMADHNDCWHENCGWYWGRSPKHTASMLRGLHKRGLVRRGTVVNPEGRLQPKYQLVRPDYTPVETAQ
jgi:hypothetical protein